MYRQTVTNEFLLEEVKKVANQLGRPPVGGTEFQYRYLAGQRFGSWPHFLEEAGLSMHADLEEGAEIRSKYIETVHKIVNVLDRVPRSSDFEDIREVNYYFRSLSGLFEAAGLEEKSNGNWSTKFINE
ncbi:hypothetical protein HCJ57_15530 [Listeria booriae]|uniref:homing endonuclease associated repeat-containing protein n=1 Tax=Listeria booriae TaxID=1552123 RepID=UPI00162A429F|nr:hypothetical protein [Listeria booriae]MBC2057937.1 hypothetical protein [Listeria booriae]